MSLLRRVLIGLLIVALQWLVLGRLSIFGAYPDAVLLYVAWIGLRYGRNAGATYGFAFGLVIDAIYGTWGIHMFLKTIVGFAVGLFPANERETLLILPRQALIGGLVVTLLHNGIRVIFLLADQATPSLFNLGAIWIGSAIYTAGLAALAALFNTSMR